MVLKEGDKIHVVTRRLFDADLRRHFAGQVQAASEHAARVQGYAFIFDQSHSGFIKRPELRVRILSLTDASVIINILPESVDLNELKYAVANDRLVLTDGRAFSLDINEFSAHR